MVNNRTTYQRQSWIPEAPMGEQALFIPAASGDNHLLPAIIEEHKLCFNPCKISLMFMWDQDNHTPGIYIKQIHLICMTSIEACAMPSRYPSQL